MPITCTARCRGQYQERERERERYVPLDIIASIASLHVVRGCVSAVYKNKKCICV